MKNTTNVKTTSLWKQFSLCLLTCMMAVLMVLPAGMAEAAKDCLYDQAGLMKPTEQTAVREALKKIEAKYNVRVAVVTVKNAGNANMADYAAELRRQNYTDGAKGNMVLVLDASRRKWQVSTDATMKNNVVDQEYGIKAITNSVVPHLKKNEYGKAFMAYANTADELLAYAADKGHPHRKGDDFSIPGIIAGILFALGGGKAVDKYLRGTMTNIETASQAKRYLKEGSFVLDSQHDEYLYSTTMVVPRNTGGDHDSSSDGGGDGGSDGGGGGGGNY